MATRGSRRLITWSKAGHNSRACPSLPSACSEAQVHTVKRSTFGYTFSILVRDSCSFALRLSEVFPLQALPYRCPICCLGFIGEQDLARHFNQQGHMDFARDLGIFLYGMFTFPYIPCTSEPKCVQFLIFHCGVGKALQTWQQSQKMMYGRPLQVYVGCLGHGG